MKVNKIKHAIIAAFAAVFAFVAPTFAENVAKVGSTEYATIDEAIAAWGNNTTLTLLADVTLSDVVTLKSTEHHTLNLGTHTLTAASGKNAIEITCNGRSGASYALTVNADATNPGGITATGKSCVYYSKSDSTKDRPIIQINNGVFNGSYSISSKSNGNTNCPQIWIYNGIFNGNVNLTKNMLRVFGGVFHGWINCSGDTSAYRQIKGGRFKSWQFMTADAVGKFFVGDYNQTTKVATYDVGVYVDDEGYLVVGGPVITELSAKYKAVASNATKWSSYLAYSSAATYGLFYTNPEAAIAKHGAANVTVYKQEVTAAAGVTAPEGVANNTAIENFTVEVPEEVTKFEIQLVEVAGEVAEPTKVVFNVEPKDADGTKVSTLASAITFRLPVPATWDGMVKVSHDGALMGMYTIQESEGAKFVELSSDSFSEFALEQVEPVATIGDTPYYTLADAVAAVADNTATTITLLSNVTVATSLAIPANKIVTLDLNGKTVTASGQNVLRNNEGATLTVKNGTVQRTGDTAGYAVSNDNAGSKMTLQDVTIKGGVYTSGTLTTENANISQHFASRHSIYASGCAVTINGGTYHNYNAGNATIFVANGASVTINDGVFSIDNGKQTQGWTSNLIDVNNGSCDVKGGTIKGHFRVQAAGELTLEGGTFENTHSEGHQIYTGGTVSVKGGTFTDDASKTFAKNYLAPDYKLGNDGKVVAIPVLPGYVVLPDGVTNANYEEMFGENTVTDGTTYYATLQAAVEAVCGNAGATLYCKPDADVGSLQHAPVTANLTVYGNGASVTGGAERDFDIGNTDPSGGKDITADMTLTVKNLNGCGAWGAKATAHIVNLVFEDCQNMGKVFITGTTGTLNITIKDSSFEGVIKEAVYSNADGAITLTNVDFSNLDKAVNLNHKATGTQTVTIDGCSFTNCGNNVANDQIPVRVLSSVDGGKSVLTVSGTTFSGTPTGGADILLDYGVGETTANISTAGTAANVVVEKTNNNGTPTTVPANTQNQSFVTVEPVAKIGETLYKTLEAAFAAAQNGDIVTIFAGEYAPINISNKNITLQGTVGANGELLTVIKGGNPAITGHGFNGTIKDIKVVDAFKVMYAEPAGNVTVDNIYVTGATYGLNLVAYSTGLTWTIQNSYMDLSWANSFGVYGGDAAIVITGNTFASTHPYYPDYGALAVNTFLPNVTVEGNVFGKNVKIFIDDSVTDTSKINISKNYHADGVDKAFAVDEDGGKTVAIYEYYSDVELQNLVVRAAKIGDNYYASLEAAAAAAKSGDEIVLLANATVEGTLAIPAGVTIKSNGKTINGSIRMLGDLELNGPLTITGGLWVGKSGETLTATLSGDKLTAFYFMFQRGTYTLNADIDAVYGYLSYEATIDVNSTIHTTGTNGEVLYINGNVTLNDGAVLDSDNSVFVSYDNAVLTLKPGSKIDSKVNITTSGAKVNIDATGMTAGATANITGTVTNSGNGTVAVVGNDKLEASIVGGKIVLSAKPVAKIGETKYTTLAAALAAAQAGETITLLMDVEISGQNAMDKLTAKTLDLNAKTLTVAGNSYFKDGTTTLKNGNIVVSGYASDSFFCGYTTGAKIVFDDVTVTGTDYSTGCAVFNANLGTIEVKNSTINLSGDTTGGIFYGGQILVDSSTVTANDVCRGFTVSTVTIKDSTVALSGTAGNSKFETGLNSSTVTINNSTVAISNASKRAVRLDNNTLTLENSSTLTATGCAKDIVPSSENSDAVVIRSEDSTINATNEIPPPVAMIGTKGYKSLQAAINAVKNGETITLVDNITENVTVTEKVGLYYTIDGEGNTMNGTISVNSLSDTNDNRRITIKNIKFVDTADANVDFISSVNTNHYPRITVEGCSFTGSGNDGDVAIRLKSSHSVVIKDCTGSGLHSFLQNTSGWNLTIENVTVSDSKSGLALGTVQGVSVKGCEIAVAGYGIRMDAQYNNNATLESNKVAAFIPVVVRKAEVDSKVTVSGTNEMIPSNTDGLWFAAGTSEYEENGKKPTAPTGKVVVTLNDANLPAAGVYGNYGVALVNGVKYVTLKDAVAAVADGGVIMLIANETFTEANRTSSGSSWYEGLYYVGDKSFTINLNGFTITQNGAVNDYLMLFKNEGSKANTITLQNGTMDAGSTAYCAICTSSASTQKIIVNLENVNVIGNNSNGSVLKIRDGTELNVKAGTKITGKNSYLAIECVASTVNIYDGAEIYMNGTSSYNGCLVGACGNGVVNVYGGYGKGVKGGFIAMTSGGTINVFGGEWIANNDGTVGNNSNLYVLTAQNNKYESGHVGASVINVTGGTFRGGMDAWVLNNVNGEKAELNIAGGNFNKNPDSFVVSGYVASEADGIYTVAKAVVKVAEAYYATLQAAVNAAQDGETLNLLEDITGADVTIGKAITLDLGGKTVNDAYIKIASDVTVQNGAVKNVNESYPLVVNSGTLNIENVAIEASKSDRAIWLRNSGTTLNFNSGSILATKGENNSNSKIYGVYVSQGATANINGGTITVDAGENATAVAIFGNYVNTVNVNGGKISTSGKNYSYAIWTEGNVTVTGGEIVTNEKRYGYSSGITYGYNYAIYTKGDVEVTGGKITTNGFNGHLVYAAGSNQEVAISGVEFSNVLTEADKTVGGHSAPSLINGSNVTAEITGGEFNGVSSALVKGSGSALAVSGGMFDVEIKDEYIVPGFQLTQNADGAYSVVVNPAYGKVAKIGETYYETLQAAVNAAQEGDTVQLLAVEISEGTVKLPATLKNVTIKGVEGAVLKDMTISAADGNSYSYIGLTFDGITFDNSRLLFTGWRNGEETIKDLTIVNCEFKNLNDTTNTAAVHINKEAAEAVKNFTFTNNVIDGATGGSKSGIYLQATGNVIVKDNVINNVSFRPYVIQITTDDGIADNFVVSGNTFSGSAVGRTQGLGNNPAGTDSVVLKVNNNIFKGITDAQQICYWNFNATTTTADLSNNYYDIDIVANPGKIYYNSAAADTVDLIEKGVYPYYTELNADGTIKVDSLVQAPAIVAQIGNTKYLTFSAAVSAAQAGDTITLLADVELPAPVTIGKSIAIDGNGKVITQSASCENTHALLYFDARDVLDVTIENVVFDGIKGGAAIRTLGANITVDNCVFQNGEHTQVQGLLRLTEGKAIVKDSKFLNNTCSMAISFNYDTNGLEGDTFLVDNCVFEGNIANTTALVYYVKGAGCEIKNSEFVGNRVNCNANGATVYLGFQEDCVVTGNLFKDNVVADASTSTRVAGAVFFGYQAEVSGNAFVNNTASNANGDTLGQICTSTYYDCAIDLSGNYWGGKAPVYGKDYTIQHQTGEATFVLDSYYSGCEIDDANGNVVLSNEVELVYVAKVGKLSYPTVTAAIAAAQDGDTVQLLSGEISEEIKPWATDSTHASEKSITILGAADFGTKLTGGLYLGYDDSGCREHTITVKGIAFEGKGILVAGQKNVVIEGNKFTDITAPVATTQSATANAISVIGKNVIAVVKDNEIANCASGGIHLRDVVDATVMGNTVDNVQNNTITINPTSGSQGTIAVTGNTLSDWGKGGEGRAMRISGGAVVNVNGNVMSNVSAPEEFVKITGAATVDASANYWNGQTPVTAGLFATDLANPAVLLMNYYADTAKTDLRPIANVLYIPESGDAIFNDKLMQAGDGYTIKLMADIAVEKNLTLVGAGDSVTLDLNGKTLTNNKNVTVKGMLNILANGGSVAGSGTIGPDMSEPVNETAPMVVADKTLSFAIPAGAWQYEENEKSITTIAIAKVGEDNYSDFREAVAAAKASGEALVMLASVKLSGTLEIAVGEALTINLGDETLSGKVNNGTLVVNNGSLTLVGGTIDNTGTGRIVDVANNAFLSVNGTTIGTLSDDLTVAKVAKANGATVSCTSLAQAVALAGDEDVVTLLKSVEIAELIKIEEAITLDLGGKSVTATSKKAFEVYANATIKNGEIIAANRCVDTRMAVELTLEGLKLTAEYTTTYGNSQPITIGGSEIGTKVAMENVNVSANGGYGIITFVQTALAATNCTFSGYNALYVKPGSDNSSFEFVKSTLSGSTADNDVEGNSFSTIAVRANNVSVVVDAESKVVADGDYCHALSLGGNYEGEESVTGANVLVEGEITGNILSHSELADNIVVVKADYTDALEAKGFAVEAIEGEDGLVKVAGETVAVIGDVAYATIEAALAAAIDGDTVAVVRDIALTQTVTIDKAVTIDLEGNTVTGADGAIVFNVKADTVLQNGSIKGNKSGTSSGLIDIYANLKMSGVTVETSKILALRFKAGGFVAELNDCSVTGAFKGYGASVWDVRSGTYKASSTSISEQINGTACISGGVFYYAIKEENCAPGYVLSKGKDADDVDIYTVAYAPACFVDLNGNGTLDEGEPVYGNLDQVFANHKSGDVNVVLTANIVANAQVDTTANATYNFTSAVAGGVTMDFLFEDNWNYIQKMSIGENITLNAKYLLAWAKLDISGDINADYLYMMGAEVTVNEGATVNILTGDATVQVKGGTKLTVNGELNTAILNVWVDESELKVSGSNAKVSASWIDIWDGAPTVIVENGATLESQKVKVSRGGNIVVDGATLKANLEVGHNGESKGVLTLQGNATVDGEIKFSAPESVVNGPEGLTVTPSANYQLIYENGQYKQVAYADCVAKIGGTYYRTLAEALSAAENEAVVELLGANGKTIAMNGSVYGKTVTITGTADVDWSKGFLFIGRGGEGNGTVIFKDATLVSKSNSASYGIHVSGREKNTNNKYDGTLVIENSTIELDYLINKGSVTLDISALTVKNGFAVGGRPANETESDEDATAYMNLINGSTLTVNNHNGMGLGYEALGVMTVDNSSFVCTQAFLVTAKGAIAVANGGSVAVEGTLTNKGEIELAAGTQLVATKLNVEGVLVSAGDITGAIVKAENGVIELSGGTYSQDVHDWCVAGYASVDNPNGTYTVTKLPEMGLEEAGRGIVLENLAVPETMGVFVDEAQLDVAVKLVKPTEVASAFANYLVDFYVTLEGLPEEGVIGGEYDYLAGDFGPAGKLYLSLEDVELKSGMMIPVLGSTLTYGEVCASADDFMCGIYLGDSTIDGLVVAFTAALQKNEESRVIPFGDKVTFDLSYGGAVAIIEPNFGPYYSISEALMYAGDGDTIKLLADTTEKITIPEGLTVTLDLNGKTLSGSILAPNANLTVKNGTIVNTDKSVSAIEINAGTLNLENVEIESARHAIRVDGDVEVTIDGGKYSAGIGEGTGTYHALNVSGNATVTIDGGKFVGPEETTANSGAAVCVQSGSTVTIKGGNFSGGKNVTLLSGDTLKVEGGTYNQDPSAYLSAGYATYAAGTGFGVMKSIKLDIKVINNEPVIGYAESDMVAGGKLILKATSTLDGTITWTTITSTKDDVLSDADDTKDWVKPAEGYRFFTGGVAK